jgi:hypothetical protein
MSKTTINEVEINGQTYVLKGTENNKAKQLEGMDYVVVRTYSAGVFAGYLKSRDSKEVQLVDAIRLWYWDGAASLSQLATDGVSKPTNCKFGVPVNVTLTEAVEIIETTDKARESIQGVESWIV